MKSVEIHVHGVYTIEVEDDEDIAEAVEQSFIDMFDYDPSFGVERYDEC